MKKSSLVIVILLVCLIATAGVVGYIGLNSESLSQGIATEQVIGNLEYGMSKAQAQETLKNTWCSYVTTVGTSGDREYVQYAVYDYMGIDGGNCDMQLTFDNDKLIAGIYYFRDNTGSKTECDRNKIDEVQKLLGKAYEAEFEESINKEYYAKRDVSDSEYGRYFVGDKSLIFLNRESDNCFVVRFSDKRDSNVQELINLLKKYEAEKTPDKNGYYDGKKK